MPRLLKRVSHLECARRTKRRLSESVSARTRYNLRQRVHYTQNFLLIDDFGETMAINHGRSRSYQENVLLICAIIAEMRRVYDTLSPNKTIKTYSEIDRQVAKDFKVGHDYIRHLRECFMEDGDIFMFGGNSRGLGALHAKASTNTKITEAMKKCIASFIDERHSQGQAVTSRYVLSMLIDKFNVSVHRTTIGRTLKSIGLQWLPIGRSKRSYSSYRRKAIRDYLINLDVHLKHQATRRAKSVFVFTDESYCNINKIQFLL